MVTKLKLNVKQNPRTVARGSRSTVTLGTVNLSDTLKGPELILQVPEMDYQRKS